MKDKNIKLSWIPRFSPPGSAASKKRLNKPVLILFALAIIFAILGFIDLKVNAAESDTYVSSWWSKVYVDSNGEEQVAKNDWYTYTSSSPLEVYYYQSHDDYVADTPVSFSIAVVSDSPITASGSTSSFKSTEYVFDDKTIYVCMSSSGTSFASPLSGYVEVTTDADNARRLNSSYTRDDFANAYYNNTLDLGNSYELDFVATMFVYEDSSCTTLFKGYPEIRQNVSYVSGKPISVYYYQTFSTPSGGDYEHYAYLVSQDHIYSNGVLQESGFFESNGVTYYYAATCLLSTGFSSDNPGFFELIFSGSSELYKLNSDKYEPDAYGREQFVKDIQNGILDSEQIIDYDSLKIDDSMPYPYNFKLNKVVDESESFDIIYDYITWNSDFDYDIQVDVRPYAYIYENKKLGFDYGNLVDFKDWGEAFITDIVPGQSNKYIFEVFDSESYYPEMDYISEFMEFYHSVSLEYPDGTFTDYHNYYSVGYRFRYIDIANNKAGPWVVVEPDRKNLGGFCSYVWFSDGNFTSDVNSTGSNNIFNDGDLDNALINIDKENQFKDKYDVVDNEIDVLEATNWLKSVVGFIKSTPSMVGSVLGFLPQPILYGIYLVIFLGVISAGFAIIRALI